MDREVIARIIDPFAWERIDSIKQEMANDPRRGKRNHYRGEIDGLEAASLAKADAILSQDHASVGALRAALDQCLKQFAFYATEHAKAGNHEKATTNQRFADLCHSALTAQPQERVGTDTVAIPRELAMLIDQAFLPINPNKMRSAAPHVIEAVKQFRALASTAREG
jgi:hypothetical protein